MIIKTVGISGQISLGKSIAGVSFIVEKLMSGDIMLKRALVVPMNEEWAQEPEMKANLAKTEAWMRKNPPKEMDLDTLEAKVYK